MNPYESHIPILEVVVEYTGKLKAVLEFGLGLYSTPFLIKNSNFLKSIETESQDWYTKIVAQFKAENWQPVLQLTPQAELDLFPTLVGEHWSLVFGDGAALTRHTIAQLAQWAAPIVVCHDSSEPQDYYHSVVLLDGWTWIDIKDYLPWTAVNTKEKKLIEHLQSKFQKTKTYTGTQLRHKEYA